MKFLKQVHLFFTFFVCLLCSIPAFSWNWVGHELVAQIAFDQLSPSEKVFWSQKIDQLRSKYPSYFKKYSKQSFIRASTFPDDLRKMGITKYNSWHFIDLPVYINNDKGAYFPNSIDSQNIIWAINYVITAEQQKVIGTKKSNNNSLQRELFSAFLIHLVGDAHQPLHCGELYAKHFPHGDRGGNFYKLKNKKFHNLHRYWDQGGGYLSWYLAKNSKLLETSATLLEKKYPKSWFGDRAKQLDPSVWVKESHELAEKAYSNYGIREYSNPSKAYQKEVEEVTQEQIVLAGYRLAAVLKEIERRD